MKNRRNFLVFYVLALLLAACQGSGPVVEQQATATQASVAADTLIPELLPTKAVPILSRTVAATKTQGVTATPAATGTPTISLDGELQVQCIEASSDQESWTSSDGVLLLDSLESLPSGLSDPKVFLLDMASGRSTQIVESTEEIKLEFHVSPDRKLVAYKHNFNDATATSSELVIATSDGNSVKTFPYEAGWSGIAGWLGNEHIVINLSVQDPEERVSAKPSTLLALNLTTGEQKILKPDYPDIYSLPPVPSWEGWSVAIYDPALTRVAYLQNLKGNESALALMDLETREILVSLVPYSHGIPRWSPDGSRLAADTSVNGSLAMEMVLIDRDGKIDVITNLSASGDLFLLGFSWSLDGRYLAAWMTINPFEITEDLNPVNTDAELIIIDTETRQVVNTCVKIQYQGDEYSRFPPPPPIWSPNGEQLVVVDWGEEKHSQVILVDLLQGTAAEIAQGVEPLGWMLAP